MKRYKVWVCLEATFDGDEAIEAENEEDAFIQASNMAMGGCSWEWNVEEIEENEGEDNETN